MTQPFLVPGKDTVMIGQEKIKHILKTKVPNSIILLGDSGSGKSTLARYISQQIGADFVMVDELSVPQMKQLTEDVSFTSFNRVYCIENVQDMTHLAQNVLLKTLEDINAKATIVLCTNDKSKLLATIISRCVTIPLNTYSTQELEYYAKTRSKNTDIKYCLTPGDIVYKQYLIDTGIYTEVDNLAKLIVTSIQKAQVGNVFKIISRLETISADKTMVLWLLNMLTQEFKDDYRMGMLCIRYRYHIQNNNTDWKRTLEQLFVELNVGGN